jgi:hypothetical protein
MESRVGGFNPEEYHQGMRLREQQRGLPPLTPEQVASALRILGRREEEYLQYIQANPDIAQAELKRHKAELTQRKGAAPSRPNLTAEKVTMSIYYPMHNAALEAYNAPGLPKPVFTSWYDYASGIAEVTSDVFEAEQYIEGVSDRTAAEAIAQVENTYRHAPPPIDHATQGYLYLMNKSKRSVQLLMDDPTGKTLIATAVNEIARDAGRPAREREYHRILPFQEPRLVLAGAEFARRAYEQLYPLTDFP